MGKLKTKKNGLKVSPIPASLIGGVHFCKTKATDSLIINLKGSR